MSSPEERIEREKKRIKEEILKREARIRKKREEEKKKRSYIKIGVNE